MILATVIGISAASLVVAWGVARHVLAKDTGTAEMRKISDAIQEGAEAFLRRQYRTIGMLAILLAAVLFVLYGWLRRPSPADPIGTMQLALFTTVSFLLGALCSGIAGYIGMWVSIRTNIRTASAARTSLNGALQTALRGGAVSGIFVVAMSLLGVSGIFWFILHQMALPIERIPLLIVGFGFGASFVALFAQLGGGIYTKAADVGADLVGKVEAGIPEDDPRNPAVIADLVGDNVGDCAGRGADLFESISAENVGAMILGAALFSSFGVNGIFFPLAVAAVGLLASMVGIMMVKARGDEDPMNALNRGFYITAAVFSIGFFFLCRSMLAGTGAVPDAWIYFFACGMIGVVTSILFLFITQYYTEYRYRPVKEIADASVTGPGTNIISGLAVGFESTAMPVIVMAAAIITSYRVGLMSGVEGAGFFGTAVATMGMLGAAAYVLAMDTFGPITDNAGGIIEMSRQPESVRNITDRLDSVGNTTKALTKGYAIGSAALAAFLLFTAYMVEVRNYGAKLDSIDLSKPEIFSAALIGAMLVFLFTSTAIRAVGRAAQSIIEEVRRQFKAKPGIMTYEEEPEYGTLVDIATRGALKQMVLPGALAVGVPIVTGLIFKSMGMGAEAMGAFLMVATIAGILMALTMNNGGGAWDNAKKYIETGAYGGKGSDAHKAAVVGDTVGDPFKDTAGPSLHVLIKLLATITLVLAPFFI